MEGQTIVDIDPKGDVILELSSEEQRVHLRVSSKVLSIVSPVFAAMFSSRFQEGLKIAGAPSDTPSIPLPEDDPDAFTAFCYVAHFRMKDVPQRLSVKSLEQMAILCDKYDCVGAFAHSSHLWLDEALKTSPLQDLPRVLVAAYMLDDPRAFSAVSSKIILDATAADVHKLHVPVPGSVPHDMTALLVAKKREVCLQVLGAMENATSTLLHCSTAYSSSLGYFVTLRNRGLWPPVSALQQSGISGYLRQLISVENSAMMKCATYSCRFCHLPGGGTYNGLQKGFTAERNAILQRSNGLCLDCLKTGRKSFEEKMCRVKQE